MHKSVLQKEVLQYLDPKPNENFIDATLGLAGHSLAILEKNKPKGKVLGVELDSTLYKKLLTLNADRLFLVNDSFINLREIVRKEKLGLVSGILFDLGLSNWHLKESKRGFSFLRDEFLDMRFQVSHSLTAGEIINSWPEREIKNILEDYGEEKFARRITQEIVRARKQKPITRTFQLSKVIQKAVPTRYQYLKKHFATKTFQALRIAVNDELSNLERILPQALDILEKNGRLVVISFHSLEDRIVKNYFKREAKNNLLKILTKKPIRPTEEEVLNNPSSRSAKLRAAVKL